MWGKKKPTIFDQAQDQQLKTLIKNQQIMIENQNYLLKDRKVVWSWLKWLEKHVKDLEARMTANEQKDVEQAALFANLSRTATQTEVTTEG